MEAPGPGETMGVRTPPPAMVSILEMTDERDPRSEAALQLIAAAFARPDRQPLSEIRSEIAEKRLDLLAGMEFHLLVALSEHGEVMATIAGMYLEGVNAGFITYLTADARFRRRRLGRRLRTALVELFRADARRAEFDDLAWVLGEVEASSPWLKRLIRSRGAVTFDLTYYHPGMSPDGASRPYVLYRQPVGDPRILLPVDLVRRVLYSIYRRGYRVRYPLEMPGFAAMLQELEGRVEVGPIPD